MKSENKVKTDRKLNLGKYTRIFVCMMATLYAAIVLGVFLKPDDAFSQIERRTLAQYPEFDARDLWSGKYANRLEKYMVDQFPFRDELRFLKSNFSIKVMQKQDTHNIYVRDDYLCKMEYPMDEQSILNATMVFQNLYGLYMQDTEVKPYLAVIPDKNYFMASTPLSAIK